MIDIDKIIIIKKGKEGKEGKVYCYPPDETIETMCDIEAINRTLSMNNMNVYTIETIDSTIIIVFKV